MERSFSGLEERIASLERSLRLWRRSAVLAAVLAAMFVSLGLARRQVPTAEVRTQRLVVVDDAGHVRAVIGQDPKTTQRISRSAGLVLFDTTGAERGGFGTMDDGSVVIGLDAPRGVGSPMRDRIGLKVSPTGGAYVMLIDNATRAVAKLESDGKGGGGVQVFRWDTAARKVFARTMTFEGSRVDSMALGR